MLITALGLHYDDSALGRLLDHNSIALSVGWATRLTCGCLGCHALHSCMLIAGLRCMHDCQAGPNGQTSRTAVSGCCRTATAAGTAGNPASWPAVKCAHKHVDPAVYLIMPPTSCSLLLRITLLKRLIASARQS